MSIEDKWTADESFIFKDSGMFAYLSDYDRTYNKINKGKAIAIIVHTSDGWTCPCLVSTNPEYVKSNCYCRFDTSGTNISNYEDINYGISIKYLGLTWYFTVAPWSVEIITNTVNGFAKIISIDASYSPGFATPIKSEMEKIALGILKSANIKISYSQSIHDKVKDTILNNKLFQEHTIIYQEGE